MKNKQLTKKDINKAVAARTGLKLLEIRRITDAFLEEIENAVAHCDRVEIRGFGVLRLAKIKARMNRNPKTGETLSSPERSIVRFKAGSRFGSKVRGDKQIDAPSED